MAGCDYRSCDVCGGKAFYDAGLDYEDMQDKSAQARGAVAMRYAGKEQFTDPALIAKHGQVLGYVGDWAVICQGCAKTNRVQVVAFDPAVCAGSNARPGRAA